MSLVSLNHCSSSSAVIANSCRISSYKHGHKTVSHGKFKVPIKMSNKICSTAEDLDQDLVSLSKTVSKRSFPIATFATAIAATNLLVTDAAHAVQMKDALLGSTCKLYSVYNLRVLFFESRRGCFYLNDH